MPVFTKGGRVPRTGRGSTPRSWNVSTPSGHTWSVVISLMKSTVYSVFQGMGNCVRTHCLCCNCWPQCNSNAKSHVPGASYAPM